MVGAAGRPRGGPGRGASRDGAVLHHRLALLLLVLGLPAIARAPDGGMHIYLQPLSSGASRLNYAVASIAAGAGNGTGTR